MIVADTDGTPLMPGKVEVSVQINRLSGHGVAAIDDFCQTRQLFGGGEVKFRVGFVVPAYIACAVPRFISGGVTAKAESGSAVQQITSASSIARSLR